MNGRSPCVSSALRGVAFGAAFGVAFAGAFWTALLISARFAAPTAQPELASCPPVVRAEAPRRAQHPEAESGGPALTTNDEVTIEPAATEVKGFHGRKDPSKAGALAQRARTTSGGAAPGPMHVPRRDPPRLPEISDHPDPSAGLAAGDLQQLTALLAQLTRGSGGSTMGKGGEALSPELLQTLLGGLGANGGEGVSPALLQKLLGAHGSALAPDLGL